QGQRGSVPPARGDTGTERCSHSYWSSTTKDVMAAYRIALKLRATRSAAQGCGTTVRARQGANTPFPLKRSPPASFKRLLGRCSLKLTPAGTHAPPRERALTGHILTPAVQAPRRIPPLPKAQRALHHRSLEERCRTPRADPPPAPPNRHPILSRSAPPSTEERREPPAQQGSDC